MSTAGAVGGKERSSGINFWLFILLAALVAFGLNFYFATKRSTEEGKANNRRVELRPLR